MAAKWNKIKIKINVTICIFSTLELSSKFGKQQDVNEEREKKRLVKEIKRQLNK